MMNYTSSDVEILLRDYRNLKKEEALSGERKKKVVYLERCLDVLDPYEREIVVKTVSDGMSVRELSRRSGMSRNFITKERERILLLLSRFFKIGPNE